jgi:4-hydroxy 2-oxovalerate aldolase
MHELLSMISEDDKISFSPEKANGYYIQYQENYVDDHDAVAQIKENVAGRTVLILAPGLSLKTHAADIKFFIEEHNPVIFGVNKASDAFLYDYIFIVNEKRLTEGKPANVRQCITTSNLRNTQSICVNYSSYLHGNNKISDDPTLMLINLLVAASVRSISIAGFDGFSANPDDNYFATGMSLGSNMASKMYKNEMIREQVSKIREQIELNFVTPSLYLK